ncbi:MAG: DUF2330 domain-containing protein [Leptolyngbyaceae cyanobacterium]
MRFDDARDYQILFLASFLILGVSTRGWDLDPKHVVVAIAACILTQWSLELGRFYGQQFSRTLCGAIAILPTNPLATATPTSERSVDRARIPFSVRSPLITALSLSLLLRADHEITMLLAGGVAIASKFFIRVNGKHCFNPANIGIIAALVLTHDAWVSPGQWGEEVWYILVFAGAGGLVLKRVGRWDTSLAFLGTYAALLGVRTLWLGWTMDVWLHQLMSGSLLLFALFMVTDPRSIPNARAGRVVWSMAIALLAFILQTIFFVPSAIFFALFAIAPFTPLIDRWWSEPQFQWKAWAVKSVRLMMPLVVGAIAWTLIIPDAQAFCGFYVAKADTNLYNQASQVIIARDGQRTVLTMSNDYQGDVSDFAMVVPVPTVLQEDQVQVSDAAIIQRLDDFSAPRLVEYFDGNPCALRDRRQRRDRLESAIPAPTSAPAVDEAFGVTVEAQFVVGEYDIVILSAEESDGLETWLQQNGYRIPNGSSQLLQPYIRQNMKFFVAKVNLDTFDRSDYQSLRPLQIAYESPRFMLPIRLGMINADAEQDLLVYLLSPQGRVELSNYRTVNVPSNMDLPVFVKNEFPDFYRDMFQKAYEKEGRNVAFLEYAWNMSSCDPCSAPILSPDELRQSGVFWLNNDDLWSSQVFISRLHVRYTRNKFPEDLMFQTTPNSALFQGRYVLRHPYLAAADCREGEEYRRSLPQRFEQEAQTLAQLTGWNIDTIRQKLPAVDESPLPWWRRLLPW